MGFTVTTYQEYYPNSTVTQAISDNFAIPILLGSIGSTGCGILFGLSFLLIARSISLTSHIREYDNQNEGLHLTDPPQHPQPPLAISKDNMIIVSKNLSLTEDQFIE